MPRDPSTYSGIPNEEVQYGVPIRTGLAGDTLQSDYQFMVYDQNGVPYPPGSTIPRGATVSLGYPAQLPSATGGDVVTGTDLVEQAERIRASQDASRIAQEQVNIQKQQLAQQGQQFDATFRVQQEQANRQFELDKAMLGETTAARLFNERIQTAQLELNRNMAKLQERQFDLERQEAEFQRAGQVAAQKMDILGMLAERQGPQDWVAYNNLLNGLSAPDPQASQTIDVFDILKDIEAKSKLTAAGGGSMQFGALPQGEPATQIGTPAPVTGPPAAGAPPSPAPPPAAGGTPPPAAPAPPRTGSTNPVPAGQNNVDFMKGRLAGMGIQTSAGVGTGGGPNEAPPPGYWIDPQGRVSPKPSGTGTQQRITIPGYEHGGELGGGMMAVTGESSSGEMNPELVVNMNPDPDDQILVIPLKKLLAELGGEGVPMAEQGGMFGAMGGGVGSVRNAISKLGSKLPNQANARQAVQNFNPNQQAGTRPPPGANANILGSMSDWQAFGQPPQDTRSSFPAQVPNQPGGYQPMIFDRNSPGWNAPGRPEYRQGLEALLQRMRGQGVPMAESGGVYNAGEQIGGSNYTFNRYDPQTLGNQPFIQKLRGERESNAWTGFGASLNNRNLGLQGFPDTINVRDFMNFAPTEQAMTQDLYQRGLGVDFGDIYGRSQRAAPYGQALPVATYGR